MMVHKWPIIVMLFVMAALAGCQTIIRYPRGLLEQQKGKSEISSRELRVLLDDLVLRFSGSVEQAADQIMAASDDPRIEKNALLWKTNGISACFQAASRRDPLAAYLDLWILNKQSLELFQRPADPSLFGSSQSIAIETAQDLENSFREILKWIGNDFPIGEDFAIAFTQDYPIDNLYFNRESIAANYTKYLDRVKRIDRELMDVVGDLDEQLDQLHKLSAMYVEFLPKQARWHGELMMLETMQGETVVRSLADLSVATDAVARIADTTQTVPDLLEREREYLHQAITQERIATLGVIDQMRVETVDQLRQERVAVMAGIQHERAEVLDTIRQERIAATEDLTNFGRQTFRQVDAAVESKIGSMADYGVQFADHIFKRVAQLSVGLGAAIVILILLLRSRKSGTLLQIRSTDQREDSAAEKTTYLDQHRRRAA